MATLNIGDVRTFDGNMIAVVVNVASHLHAYTVVDINGNEWNIPIGEVKVTAANLDAHTRGLFNDLCKYYNRLYDLDNRVSELHHEMSECSNKIGRIREKLAKLNN